MRECEICSEKHLVSWAIMTRVDGKEVCILHTSKQKRGSE